MQANVLRSLLFVEIALLAVQFLVGLNISLFPIPALTNFGLSSYGGTGLGLHHYLAIFAIIFAAFAIALSVLMKNSLVSKLSVFGFALLIGAFLAGPFLFKFRNPVFTLLRQESFCLSLDYI